MHGWLPCAGPVFSLVLGSSCEDVTRLSHAILRKPAKQQLLFAVSCGVVWSHKVGTLSTLFPIVNRVSASAAKDVKNGTKLW